MRVTVIQGDAINAQLAKELREARHELTRLEGVLAAVKAAYDERGEVIHQLATDRRR